MFVTNYLSHFINNTDRTQRFSLLMIVHSLIWFNSSRLEWFITDHDCFSLCELRSERLALGNTLCTFSSVLVLKLHPERQISSCQSLFQPRVHAGVHLSTEVVLPVTSLTCNPAVSL